MNNDECWEPVSSYIESQYDNFLEAETKVERTQIVDSRVHACLYFIAPTGHGLKALDVEFMRRIHEKVKKIRETGHNTYCTYFLFRSMSFP